MARPPVVTESARRDNRTWKAATATVLTSISTATMTWGARVLCEMNRANPSSAATKCTENSDVLTTTATNGRSRRTPRRGSPAARRYAGRWANRVPFQAAKAVNTPARTKAVMYAARVSSASAIPPTTEPSAIALLVTARR